MIYLETAGGCPELKISEAGFKADRGESSETWPLLDHSQDLYFYFQKAQVMDYSHELKSKS